MDARGHDVETRLAVLAGFDVLDTPGEQAFDDIVFIAAQVCRAPIALVSLLDRERQWFKARVGLEAAETPIEQSVCSIGVDRHDLLIIPDLTADLRTRDNPLVTGETAIRFYAGAPLIAEGGVVVGRLCVIDLEARPDGLNAEQQLTLAALARQVVGQLESRRAARLAAERAELQARLLLVGERIRDSASVGEMTYGVATVVGEALTADRAGYGEVDAATERVEIAPDWRSDGVASIAGPHRFADFGRIRDELASGEPLIIDDVVTDPRTADAPEAMQAIEIGALVNMPVRERGVTVGVLIVQSRRARVWREPELTFLRQVADRLEQGVARLRAQEQQDTLNREISHRLKNTLAMVQALASQTLRGVTERGPVEELERRLLALGAAHDVLLQTSWSGAGLAEVLDAVLAATGAEARVRRRGPPVVLGARAALSFSLMVHELTTNAVKYGALSIDAGQVTVDWAVTPEADGEQLRLTWRESGGPAVTPPTRRGFGSRLIQLGLLGTGGVQVRYEPAGLAAELVADAGQLARS